MYSPKPVLFCSTAMLVLCLTGCAFGGALYAKSTFIIFIIVNAVIGCVIVNFFIAGGMDVALPSDSSDFYNQSTARLYQLLINLNKFREFGDGIFSC